uniref:Uncharacterized protein n=1 Tax=Parascaris equorum TaxID=6256 RepID=A0A914RQZ8_PAREQ
VDLSQDLQITAEIYRPVSELPDVQSASSYDNDFMNAYVANEELVGIIAELLHIKATNLTQAMTMKRTVMKNDTVITRYNVNEVMNRDLCLRTCIRVWGGGEEEKWSFVHNDGLLSLSTPSPFPPTSPQATPRMPRRQTSS